jgi:hypothetical protein
LAQPPYELSTDLSIKERAICAQINKVVQFVRERVRRVVPDHPSYIEAVSEAQIDYAACNLKVAYLRPSNFA